MSTDAAEVEDLRRLRLRRISRLVARMDFHTYLYTKLMSIHIMEVSEKEI